MERLGASKMVEQKRSGDGNATSLVCYKIDSAKVCNCRK